jgi:hypothetical protein
MLSFSLEGASSAIALANFRSREPFRSRQTNRDITPWTHDQLLAEDESRGDEDRAAVASSVADAPPTDGREVGLCWSFHIALASSQLVEESTFAPSRKRAVGDVEPINLQWVDITQDEKGFTITSHACRYFERDQARRTPRTTCHHRRRERGRSHRTGNSVSANQPLRSLCGSPDLSRIRHHRLGLSPAAFRS